VPSRSKEERFQAT